MPFDNIIRKHFDSGDYPEACGARSQAIDVDGVRARQQRGEARRPQDRRRCLHLLRAGGARHFGLVGMGKSDGARHEQAFGRLTPMAIRDPGRYCIRTVRATRRRSPRSRTRFWASTSGGSSHSRRHRYDAYSTGTWGSRSMVMAGGAVAPPVARSANAPRDRRQAAAARPHRWSLQDGEVVGVNGSITLKEVARAWYLHPQDLPPDVDPGGLEVSAGYEPQRDTGTFSYAAHAVIVAVDPDIGDVEILDYVVVEDGGMLVNPMIVDGQIYGGLAQGIGTALYEEMPFDARGQPLATTLADYLLPRRRPRFRAAPRPYGDAVAAIHNSA